MKSQHVVSSNETDQQKRNQQHRSPDDNHPGNTQQLQHISPRGISDCDCGGREIPRLRRQAITLGVMVAVNVFINIVLYRLVERAVFYSPRVQSSAGLQDEAGECPGSSQNPPRSLLKTSLCLRPVSQDNLHDRQGRLPGQSCPRVRNEPGTEDSSSRRDLQPHLRETLCLHRALVTLDPDTVHQDLILSEDGRRVTGTDKPQRRPYTSKRFHFSSCVLGRERFTSGRHYWEVQLLEGGEGWWGYVGLAGELLEGGVGAGELPGGRGWSLLLKDGGRDWTLFFCPTLLSPGPPPKNLGVYLDYEGGWLSFYNADTWEQLCTCNGTFVGGLHPYFWVGPGIDLRLV
ncbi:butyrophilin subfamily 1 member A1-like [Lissotriton helveticus]